ncbi:MAG: C25 family cysteine peptidase [Bacteroidales bacterium]|nr:C25 family cysteine peptidase [Bacteroidales bacterium]
MKKIFILSFFNFIFFSGKSQAWLKINDKTNYDVNIEIVEAKGINKQTVLKFTLNAYKLTDVNINGKTYKKLDAPESAKMLKEGAPELPFYTNSLIIPDVDEMELIVKDYKYFEVSDILIIPSKGNLLRTIDPKTVPYRFGIEYTQDDFFPYTLGYLKEPYILRDFRGQTLVIYPFQYNPVKKILRIYTEIVYEIRSTNKEGTNVLVRKSPLTGIDEEFRKIYERHFINFNVLTKYTPLSDLPGKMLIICYDNFIPYIDAFVKWKKTKGIPVDVVGVSTIGNNVNNIKNFITNYYNNNGLTYLLIVGDFSQVTSPTAIIGGVNGAKDNEYGYILGNDRYQEILIGRFSAESPADVQTQVDRIIQYEKNPTTGTWLQKNVGIASAEGPGDDNEYDYQHIRNIQTKLMNFTYTTKVELFDGSQGGLDAAGNPTANMVTNEVNPGTGCIFYCGHGGETQWVTTGFSNSNVAALTNAYKLPFIYSVSCVIGHFNEGTCFCEAWMRAKQPSGPTGAIGIMGSTINQSWSPPMEAQDEMVDVLIGTYANNIKRTFAGVGVNGLFKMNDTYADYDMTDTWTVFTDPSVVLRTKNPINLNVSHVTEITAGTSTIDIYCNVNGAYVAVTKNYQILGTGYVNNGIATITLNPIPQNVGDTLVVCVTAFNYIPHIGNIIVINNNIPIDANLFSILVPSGTFYCNNISVAPKVILKNSGLNNLTSVTINYKIDNGSVVSYNWTGNLIQNQMDTVLLPPFNLTQGTHTFYCYLTNPNGTIDGYPANDSKTINYTVDTSGLVIDFSATPLSTCNPPLTVQFNNLSTNVSSFTWDFGDGTTSTQTNPSHTYTQMGQFTVTLTANAGICGDVSIVKQNFITVGAPLPIANDVYVCRGNDAQINATANGTITWYTSSNSQTPFYIGNTYTLHNVNNDTTFWLVNTTDSVTYTNGGNTQSNTNGGYLNSTIAHYLVFDAYQPCLLKSVEVNANGTANRTIQLRDANDNVLQSITINIPNGISRINLNFNIPQGTNLKLAGPANCNLYRNNSGCQYPYNIGDVISIKYSSATTNPTGYYYYFYKWEVVAPGCKSAYTPVNVFISEPEISYSVINETGIGISDGAITLQVNGNAPFSYVWSNGATTQNIQNISAGDYTVTVTDIYGCTAVNTITVQCLNINNNLNNSDLYIYPSLAYNTLIISGFKESMGKINIYNTTGKKVYSFQFSNIKEPKIELNISELRKGIYLLEFCSETINTKKYFVKL